MRWSGEEKITAREPKPESFFAHCEGKKNASLFAFQAPKAGNKQQFLERDMLNTLPVGSGRAKRLCEIPPFCA